MQPDATRPGIACDADLERVVGRRSATALAKSISYLDEHCGAYLARSPFVALGLHGAGGGRVLVGGSSPGVTPVLDARRLGLAHLDGEALAAAGDGAPGATIALVPGYGETLRVNGRLEPVPHLEVEEAFLHCAKAVMRSHLWADGWSGGTPGDAGAAAPPGWDAEVAAFLRRSPFALLASADGAGRADLSPKGDPPGLLHLLDGGRVAIGDRKGNRRTDTLHNLVERPAIAGMALVPGEARVAEFHGTATITTDAALLAELAVEGKAPKVAVVVDVTHAEVRADAAFDASGLWDAGRHAGADGLPNASAIWADHVRRNEGTGLVARAARRVVSERVLSAGIAADYRHNLY